MIDKKTFLNKLNVIDNNIASGIYDKLYLAHKTNKTIYSSEFYTPNVWKKVQELKSELGTCIYTYGVFQYAERKVIAFSNDVILEYPINLMKITTKGKFSKLEHKDYLGSIMALGIKREKFGDLILKGEDCYLAVNSEISTYIQANLKTISNQKCTICILEIDNNEEIPAYNFQDIFVNVSSLRADCIIGAICNISRGKAEDLIRAKKVLVDYTEVSRKDKLIKSDSVITIRGYGKFKVIEEIGWTGSGRTKLLIKKFV